MSSVGPLVVVGIAGLDWEAVREKFAAGVLPGFARLIDQGTSGPLASAIPAAEIATWGTLATGLWPEEHGLVLADEPWAGGLRPSGMASWRADPAWRRLSDAGIATASINWPATTPGEAWTGVHIDDRFPHSGGWGWDDWPLPVGVAPDDWRDALRDDRVHISEITGETLSGLVPDYESVDQSRDHRLLGVARQLAAFASTHAAAKAVLQSDGLQAFFVRYDFLARARDAFTRAAAPYDQVVDRAWILLDATVTELAECAGAGTTILLMSPGYKGRAGAFIVQGPDVVASRQVAGATTLDVAPTIYAHFGRGDRRLPGRLLAGSHGGLLHLPKERERTANPVVDDEDLARVRAVGLVPPAVPLAEHRFRQLLVEAQFLLARDPHRAASLAQQAEMLGAATVTTLGIQAVSHFAAGDAEALLAISRRMGAVEPGHLWADLALAAYHALRGEAAAARPLLLRVEQEGGPDELMRAAAAYMMLDEPTAARRLFREVIDAMPDSIGALLGLASTSESRTETEELLRRVIQIDPNHASAKKALAKLVGTVQVSRRGAPAP